MPSRTLRCANLRRSLGQKVPWKKKEAGNPASPVVNQSLQSALIVVTVAKYVSRPIYSNDPVNQASGYQARHAVMAVMPAGCIE